MTLNTKPGSSTKHQRSTLVIEGKRHGFSLAEIRQMVGGSVSALSAAQCSEWIKCFSGRDLPNPPGKKPRPCDRKRESTGATRMITPDQVEQIGRLGSEYFYDNRPKFLAWLSKNFKVSLTDCVSPDDFTDRIRALATTKCACEVIVVLKRMLARRQQKVKP